MVHLQVGHFHLSFFCSLGVLTTGSGAGLPAAAAFFACGLPFRCARLDISGMLLSHNVHSHSPEVGSPAAEIGLDKWYSVSNDRKALGEI